MWLPRELSEKKGRNGLVAVAIDKDRGSQHALKWAVDHLLLRGQTVLLVHVKVRSGSASLGPSKSLPCNIFVSFGNRHFRL